MQVTIFKHAAKRMLVVAFRGSDSNKQLLGQAIDPCQVRLPGEPTNNSPPDSSHSCWGQPMRGSEYVVTALQQLLPKFKSRVQSLLSSSARGYRPLFVGHSLGGALATLASVVLARDGVVDGRRAMVYTFGSPRTGDGCFVAKFIELISTSYRITNKADPVCEIPPCADAEESPIQDPEGGCKWQYGSELVDFNHAGCAAIPTWPYHVPAEVYYYACVAALWPAGGGGRL